MSSKVATRSQEKLPAESTMPLVQTTSAISGIRDNYRRGTVGNFLKEKLQPSANLSVVSAYFTIYAFEALKERLKSVGSLRFLYGEPRFLKAIDPEKTEKKAFKIEDDNLQLVNRLEQRRVARECAEWIAEKAQIRSIKQTNLLHAREIES